MNETEFAYETAIIEVRWGWMAVVVVPWRWTEEDGARRIEED